MVYTLTIVLVFLLCSTVARAGLDLTPRLSEYNLEGIKFRQLVFLEARKEVTYLPPRDWDCSGSFARLVLHPAKKAQAEATVTKEPPSQTIAFNDENTKMLVAEALRCVPSESTEISVTAQVKNPLLISGKETFLVTLSYTLYGETYARSVLFLNRDMDQLRFQFVSRADDFKDLQKEFQRSLCSWRNL
jgi:hypothetical protein